jgi:hypothetical protein
MAPHDWVIRTNSMLSAQEQGRNALGLGASSRPKLLRWERFTNEQGPYHPTSS